MGKGVIGGYHDKYIGTAALSDRGNLHCAISRAEVIHINFNSAKVDPIYFQQLELIDGIASTFLRLTDAIAPNQQHDFAYFETARKHVLAHITDCNDDPRFPLIPQPLAADVRRIMPDDGIIALDNACIKSGLRATIAPMNQTQYCWITRWRPWEHGLPSAMMASMLYPDRRVMAIVGYGGFMMNS